MVPNAPICTYVLPIFPEWERTQDTMLRCPCSMDYLIQLQQNVLLCVLWLIIPFFFEIPVYWIQTFQRCYFICKSPIVAKVNHVWSDTIDSIHSWKGWRCKMKPLPSERFHSLYSVRIHSSVPSLNRSRLLLKQKAPPQSTVPVQVIVPLWIVISRIFNFIVSPDC